MGVPIEDLRRFYARTVVAKFGSPGADSIAAAFAAVPRERFVGPGPWQVISASGYVETPSDDLAFLYQDVVVALDASRGINNGQPSLHAACITATSPSAGETVLHIGAGTGYYTAILATLVGPTGTVIALEIDHDLAQRAKRCLGDYRNVVLENRSGTETPIPPADVIYVSAAATAPLRTWLDALRPRGRLIFPLTPAEGVGGMLLIGRTETRLFSAKFVSSAVFIPCIGGRDDKTADALTDVFRRSGTGNVDALHVDTQPDETCWFAGEGWWLSASLSRPG